MKLAKTFAVLARAGVLATGVIGSASHGHAQDVNEMDNDTGSWNSSSSGSSADIV